MRKSTIRLLIGLLISLVAIYLAATGVDYGTVGAYLLQARLPLLGLALLSIALNNGAKAWRWKLLLGERGLVVSFWSLLQLHLTGQMLNQILPARAGDLSRVYLAGDLGVNRAYVLGTLALEKLIDLVCYVLIGLLLLVMIPLPAWVSQPTATLLMVTALGLVGLAGAVVYRRRVTGLLRALVTVLPQRLGERLDRVVGDGLASLEVLADRGLAVRIGLLSGVVWFTAALTNYLVLLALGIAVPPIASVFVLFVLLIGITISSVPGQIGIFQYLCVLALAVFGVDQARALSFGVLLHLLVFLPLVVAGATALWGGGPGRRAPQPGVGESS